MRQEKHRCFIALDLEPEAREKIARLQEDLESSGLFKGKLTEKENIHLTLKFLGEIDEAMISEVKRRLSSVSHEAFFSRIREAGVFSKDRIRIIWLALDDDAVKNLQSKVDYALEDIFAPEKRFMGHITIARVRAVHDRPKLIGLLQELDIDIHLKIRSFSLMRSTLTHSGPIYETLQRYNLQ